MTHSLLRGLKPLKIIYPAFRASSLTGNTRGTADSNVTDSFNPDILPNSSKVASEELTVADVRRKLLKCMGLERGYKPLLKDRHHLLGLLATNQSELPTRTMQDSFTSAIIPLSTDVDMQEKYVTQLGYVRLGRLMEDMDIFAVWVAFQHIHNPKLSPEDCTPYVIVTVLVDQIDFTDIVPKHDADIRLTGHASYVGKSTIEITVWMEQNLLGQWRKITRATFLMAARNSTNTGAAFINPLMPETEREKEIYRNGETRKQRRVLQQSKSLLKKVPDITEQQVIHNLYLSTVDLNDPTYHKRRLPSNSIWMDDAKIRSVIMCHPEDRNMHNSVFGGFLMRQALELAWTCSYVISKYRPTLKHISDIGFHKPVGIGNMLKMRAQMVYSQFNYMQIVVYAEVFDPHSGVNTTTNIFHYTFEIPQESVKVVPQSYHETMMYLDGRRHFQQVMNLKKL